MLTLKSKVRDFFFPKVNFTEMAEHMIFSGVVVQVNHQNLKSEKSYVRNQSDNSENPELHQQDQDQEPIHQGNSLKHPQNISTETFLNPEITETKSQSSNPCQWSRKKKAVVVLSLFVFIILFYAVF